MGFGDYVKAGWGMDKNNPGLVIGAGFNIANKLFPQVGQVGGVIGSLGERIAKTTLGEDNALTKNLKAFNKALGGDFSRDKPVETPIVQPQQTIDNNKYNAYIGGAIWNNHKPLVQSVRVLSDMPWINAISGTIRR